MPVGIVMWSEHHRLAENPFSVNFERALMAAMTTPNKQERLLPCHY
jgi:hypothetical protein